MSRQFQPVDDFETSKKDNSLIRPHRDPVKFIEAREQRVRERYIGLAEARSLREEVKQVSFHCYCCC